MDKNERTAVVGIERATIIDKMEDPLAWWVYRVRSESRGGVESRWMEAVSATVREYEAMEPETVAVENKYEYNVGEAVTVFMFEDGRGMILGRIRMDLD